MRSTHLLCLCSGPCPYHPMHLTDSNQDTCSGKAVANRLVSDPDDLDQKHKRSVESVMSVHREFTSAKPSSTNQYTKFCINNIRTNKQGTTICYLSLFGICTWNLHIKELNMTKYHIKSHHSQQKRLKDLKMAISNCLNLPQKNTENEKLEWRKPKLTKVVSPSFINVRWQRWQLSCEKQKNIFKNATGSWTSQRPLTKCSQQNEHPENTIQNHLPLDVNSNYIIQKLNSTILTSDNITIETESKLRINVM